MHTTTETWIGRIALLLCHVAGLLDLVILPLWVGGLIGTYKFSPEAAGGLVTLYLVGVVVSNAILAFRFDKVPAKLVATAGFLVPAAAFFIMTSISDASSTSAVVSLAALNFVGGLGAGAGMAIVHGMIGRSVNPHRLFAFVNVGIAIFGVAFFTITPPMMAEMGVKAVFINVGTVILLASLAALVAFPNVPAGPRDIAGLGEPGSGRVRASTGILVLFFIGLVFLQIGNAVTLSFVERVGDFRGFDAAAIGAALAIGGLAPFLAPLGAALLEKKLSPIWVTIVGMLFHGLWSIVLSNVTNFVVFAAAYALVIFTVVFTHTFNFGLQAKVDRTGRMNALNPTMMMMGSAIGPFLGGLIVGGFGFPAVGIGAAICVVTGALCYGVMSGRLRQFV